MYILLFERDTKHSFSISNMVLDPLLLTFSYVLQSCLCWYSPLPQLLRLVSFLRPQD